MDTIQITRQVKAALALRGKNFTDLAMHAGVSKQAISNALRARPSKKIRKAIEELAGIASDSLWPS